MGEVHGRPPEDTDIAPIQALEGWEEMGEEEGFHDGTSGMEGGEGAKNKRSGAECVGIA